MHSTETAASRAAAGVDVELAALRACFNDLLGVLTIPSLAIGRDPEQIVGTTLEVLVRTLRLDVAYAALETPRRGRAPAILARGSSLLLTVPAEIHSVVSGWLSESPATSTLAVRCPIREIDTALVGTRLGPQADAGWLLVCSRRADFPTSDEALLLHVAANQASLNVREAQLSRRQGRLAAELEKKVEQRTRELSEANVELERALKEIHLLRDELQRENQALWEQAADLRGGLARWQLKRAVDLLGENLAVQIPLARVAEECGLSVRHFARAFRQSVGAPPRRWLRNLRIERAKELLHDVDLSLSDIALACGFADQSHFSRAFTAVVRLSPGLWRRLQATPSVTRGTSRSTRKAERITRAAIR
jgi:AraC-like DNA-binding protein